MYLRICNIFLLPHNSMDVYLCIYAFVIYFFKSVRLLPHNSMDVYLRIYAFVIYFFKSVHLYVQLTLTLTKIYIYIYTHFDIDKNTHSLWHWQICTCRRRGIRARTRHFSRHLFFKYTLTIFLYSRFFFNIYTHLDIHSAERGGSERGHDIFLDKSPLEVPLGFRSLETESDQVDGSVWHESFYMCDMTCFLVCVAWLIFDCVAWLICICDTTCVDVRFRSLETDSNHEFRSVWHDSLNACGVNRSYVWGMTYLKYICIDTYLYIYMCICMYIYIYT